MRLVASIVCLISLAADFQSIAATILTDPTQLVGPTMLIDFESFPNGDLPVPSAPVISTQWQSLGLLVSDSSPQNGAQVAGSTRGIPPHSGSFALAPATETVSGVPQDEQGGYVVLTFSSPVNHVGLWIQSGNSSSRVEFFDSSSSLIATVLSAGTSWFAGVFSEQGVRSIRVSDPDYFTADDLEFSSYSTPPTCTAIGSFGRSSLVLAAGQRNYCENWYGVSQPGSDLRTAVLEMTDLRGANLNGVLLLNATLLGASLADASLVSSQLRYVNLDSAILRNTDLSYSNLTGANLSNADLTGADLSFAVVAGASYNESTVFPSSSTYATAPWGLNGGITPWDARMIPVPEPAGEILMVFGLLGLAGLSCRRCQA